MPPKRARAGESKNGEEEEEKKEASGSSGPPTAERKARAEEKIRSNLESKRAILKGEGTEKKNNERVEPSPAKMGKTEDDEEEDMGRAKFDPMKILAQAGTRKLVDLSTPGFVELDDSQLDSLNSDSFNSLSQLSPGLQLGNLSVNSGDSPNQALNKLHAAGEAAEKGLKDDENYAGGLDDIFGTTVAALKKSVKLVRRKKASDNLNAPYRRGKTIIGNSILTNVLSKVEDLALLEGTYSAPELVLISSPAYPMDMIYRKAVMSIYDTRIANEKARVQEPMSINQCLGWLACAGRCSISSLIPPGEYYPDAEDYLRVRLIVQSLPLLSTTCVDQGYLKEWTNHQLKRCMQMMAVADLRPLLVDDRCILLYAIGMLYIDDQAEEEMREAAHNVVRNALSSCANPSDLLEPLFNLTPLIVRRPDEAYKWITMFKASGEATPELILSLGASHFVFVCERAECTPDAFHFPSLSMTFTSYINVIVATMVDVFGVYTIMSHRRYHRNLISILNLCLSPSPLKDCEETSRKALLEGIQAVIRKLDPDLPHDSIVITELRTMTRRVEMKRSGRGGRKNSEEVMEAYEEKQKMKEERAEELRDQEREKEELKKQREERQRSEARSAMEDEEEEEDERMEEDEDDEEEEEKGSGTEMGSMDDDKSERMEKKKEEQKDGGATLFTDEDFMELDVGASKESDKEADDLQDTVPEAQHNVSDEL